MTLWGELGAMIDACIQLATIDDLHMQFDILIIISTGNKHVQFILSVQATVQLRIYMMVLKICTGSYVFHENWDTNSKVITVD